MWLALHAARCLRAGMYVACNLLHTQRVACFTCHICICTHAYVQMCWYRGRVRDDVHRLRIRFIFTFTRADVLAVVIVSLVMVIDFCTRFRSSCWRSIAPAGGHACMHVRI